MEISFFCLFFMWIPDQIMLCGSWWWLAVTGEVVWQSWKDCVSLIKLTSNLDIVTRVINCASGCLLKGIISELSRPIRTFTANSQKTQNVTYTSIFSLSFTSQRCTPSGNKFHVSFLCWLGLRFLVRLCTDMGLKEVQDYATKLKKVEKMKEIREQVECLCFFLFIFCTSVRGSCFSTDLTERNKV